MTLSEIVATVIGYKGNLVILTGGEPGLYVDKELVAALKSAGKSVCIETNGTCQVPENIDFITLSPKDAFCDNATLVLSRCDELKVVFCGDNDPSRYDNIFAGHRILQPCDTGDSVKNASLVEGAFKYCLDNPQWRLGLQMHKILHVR